jgi:hypothetical protein
MTTDIHGPKGRTIHNAHERLVASAFADAQGVHLAEIISLRMAPNIAAQAAQGIFEGRFFPACAEGCASL